MVKYMPKVFPALLLLVPLLSGCGSVSYYSQAISGHLSLMAKRQPIRQLLEQSTTEGVLKERLLLAQSIRDFASDTLKLPDNGSYRSFVPVEGEAVVWSLVATGKFSVEPKQWCYLVIGCASYRGYFDLGDAQRYKSKLEAEGLDVALDPVPAYSTLGWFDDPLPGTVIRWRDWQLAGLIFHELAHQRLYVTDNSAFNEAFAKQVQQAGVARWLESARSPQEREAWQLSQQRQRAFVQLLMETRNRLKVLYGSSASELEKTRGKEAEFNRLTADYQRLKQRWDGYSGYDVWFQRRLNNARLASIATYEEWTPVFELLLKRANGKLEDFYAASERLGELPPVQRLVQIQALRRAAEY